MMSDSEKKIIATLDGMGIAYEVIEVDPNFSDTAAFCEKYGYPLQQTCNTIIVTSKKGPKKYAACVVLADTRLDVNKRVRQLIGASRASFAPAEEVKELTGMEIGGVTPLALPPDLPILVDERVMHTDWVILGGGGRRLKIKIAPEVFNKLGADLVSELAFKEGKTEGNTDENSQR